MPEKIDGRIDLNRDVKMINGKLCVRKEKVDALVGIFTTRIIEKRKAELKNHRRKIEVSQL